MLLRSREFAMLRPVRQHLSDGRGSTLIDYKLCYIVITLLWMLSGMIGGQIKSLRNFAVFANLNMCVHDAI